MESSIGSEGSEYTHDIIDPHSWVSRYVLAQSSVFRENDISVLFDFQQLVRIYRREECDLLGAPYGVPVCSLIEDGSKFFIHSAMVTEEGVIPPFSPFQQRFLKALRAAPSQFFPSDWGPLWAFEQIM